jgi:predicted GIY-YIG superfamily endonuclease
MKDHEDFKFSDSAEMTLEEALQDRSHDGCFHLYKIEIGGEIYIGFTSQEAHKRMEQHLESARNGSSYLIHKKLREFGFYYDFTVIGTYSNEVEALLNEIISIKKFNAKLNISEGGEGKRYKIVRKQNEHGESVFKVIDKVKAEKLIAEDNKFASDSNGSILGNFLRRLIEAKPSSYLIAEAYEKINLETGVDLSDIHFSNICHLHWIDEKIGKDFGIDREILKHAAEKCLHEIEHPSEPTLARVLEKESCVANGLLRAIRVKDEWVDLELNKFYLNSDKDLWNRYESRSVFLPAIKGCGFTEKNTIFYQFSSTRDGIPIGYKGLSVFSESDIDRKFDFDEEKIRSYFNKISEEKFILLKNDRQKFSASIRFLYCFGTFSVKEKSFFTKKEKEVFLSRTFKFA